MEQKQVVKAPLTVQSLFQREDVRTKIEQMLGERTPQFITSVLQVVSSSQLLKHADPMSVYHSAVAAATFDLPLNNNLGFTFMRPGLPRD